MGSTQTFNMKALEGMCGSSENDRRVTHGISSKKAERQVGPGRWEHPSGYGQVGVVAGGVSSDCAVTPGQVPRRAAPPPRWCSCGETESDSSLPIRSSFLLGEAAGLALWLRPP